MAYPQYGGYQPQTYYPPTQPMPDQLAYLRQQQMQPMQQPAASPLWVQGEAGAKAYPVAPGSSVILMDSESNVFYIKSADQSGMPTMRTFEYRERTAAQNPPVQAAQQPQGDYVTRSEFDALRQQIYALIQPAPVTVEKEAN